MPNRFRYAILCSVVASMASAGIVMADSKIYPGELCRGRASAMTMIDVWRGRAFNVDSYEHWVHCPVVRDIVDVGGAGDAWVKVVDRHYYDDVSCGMWSQNVDSYDGWSGYVVSRSSSGSSTSVQTLYFPTLSNYSTYSSYTMECLMPGRYAGNSSQIVAYLMGER